MSLLKQIQKLQKKKRIKFIVDNVNTDTDFGLKIKEAYKRIFGKEIQCFVHSGGRKHHYDIKIIHSDATFSKCEEKGTNTFNQNISECEIP